MIHPSLAEAKARSGYIQIPTTSCDRVRAAFNCLVRLWASLQVSYYGGRYSIERVLALDKYTRTTSLLRVFVVCVGTPMPMVALVTLQELLPLQEPEAGWRRNYGFWCRVFMLGVIVSHTYLIQGKYMVDGFAPSSWQLVVFVLGISGTYTGIGMIVAANLLFPIPFFYITMTPAFYVPLLILLYCTLGKSRKLTKYVCFIATQKMMGMLYPIYQLLFHRASTTDFVLPVILLLPVVKLVVKNVVLYFTHHLEDLTPEAVIFTVDFYNALYLATCMESASTLHAMLIFIVTDFAQTATVLLGMHRRTATISQRLLEATGALESESVLSALSSLCQRPSTFQSQNRGGVHVRSCFRHSLDRQDLQLLCRLERLPGNSSDDPTRIYLWSSARSAISETRKLTSLRLTSISSSFSRLASSRRLAAIQPMTKSTAAPKRRQDDPIPTDVFKHSNILRETLGVLYTAECLVLMAYVEAFIPLFYCTYMLYMVQLPNAEYHTELRNVNRQNVAYTTRVVFLFGLLQVASFVLLVLLVRRNCGIQIWYNLAFVLETQMALVQGKLMVWMLVTLACRVVHFGKRTTRLCVAV
ncbi:hypothetical protein PF005_g9643 [Phytophthora fragariae]|uniref:Uncharacterized protein n=1 Tax=Phytophthora fragariae TaxID=53985 RepID=A0A6A3SWR4_9STRA|nr:hypothetical protein PF003_g22140 [Phytophthora fragariae]KAE8939443.1 hypothetical protein PF009_g10710 [Phytophthora fragariae]KAE9116290.1 hypothetical protein PF010_g9023 [Phytophthora fragariae]KAE9122718.1 hypothetical protein PF006_g17590 [Phytophthora fragariae]KAE9214924.1 hypothetical protein PF005_g9643 [Phytophthora fragariae]